MSEPTTAVCNAMPNCPLCGGQTQVVYDQPAMKVCMCDDCHTGIHVPIKAWNRLLEGGVAHGTPAPPPPTAGPRLVRPDDDKGSGHAPPEDIEDALGTGQFGYR